MPTFSHKRAESMETACATWWPSQMIDSDLRNMTVISAGAI